MGTGTSRVLFALSVAVGLTFASCAPRDPAVPWDVSEMIRELTADLRHQGVSIGDAEVLAWRTDEEEYTVSPLLPPRWRRVEVALMWGRGAHGGQPWVLAQGYRHWQSDEPWRLSMILRELRRPPAHLRPGEAPDGSWRAFSRYPALPTSADICEFARVDFLNASQSPWRPAARALQRNTWQRLAGEPPSCDFER